ncbi:hypothetical protein [uncultured Nitratireductor sp.]|uniref:hypothetical protein n=1 Tax=uncultured Nitratireductor sp. TaxID=520953 RepID=UPI002602D88A|nr:hypothetical protein [uncultured Nitratireductor sp.]
MKDKTRKKMTAAAVSRKEIGQGCFFMFLDGDDILLPNLFSEVRGRVTDGDIVLRSGYMVDESTKAVAKIAPPNSSFYKVCGSCFVSKVTPSDIPMTADDRTAFVANLIDHTKFIEVSTRHKRDCVYLDDPFAVYYVGHGSNDHTIRGATPYIADLLKRGAVETDEANSVLSLITAMKPKSAI